MMGKTHLAMGMAVSFAVVQPKTWNECLVAVIGGAAGGVLADIDILDNDNQSDALGVQFIAVAITALALLIDWYCHLGICDYIIGSDRNQIVRGVAIFAVLCIFGIASAHRKFTHSLTAMAAFTYAVKLIYPPAVLPFMAGYLSHLALDLLNKRKLQILYPFRFGICLNLCYAGKTANKMFLCIGSAATCIFLAVSVMSICFG